MARNGALELRINDYRGAALATLVQHPPSRREGYPKVLLQHFDMGPEEAWRRIRTARRVGIAVKDWRKLPSTRRGL